MSFQKTLLVLCLAILAIIGVNGVSKLPKPLVKKPYLIEQQLHEGVAAVDGLHLLSVGKYKILAVSDEQVWTARKDRCLFQILLEDSGGEKVLVETSQPPEEIKVFLTSPEVMVERPGVLKFTTP